MASDARREYSEVFEEGVDAGATRTVHRLRANSSILQQKKILGQFDPVLLPHQARLDGGSSSMKNVWDGSMVESTTNSLSLLKRSRQPRRDT